MLAVSVVCDFVGSAGRIRHNTLIVIHCGNCKLIAVSVLDPIKLSVCIEVILGLSRICNSIFIAGFCHCAVSVKALESAVAVILERCIGAVGEHNLIVTGGRNNDFAHIDIEVPAYTEAALFIAHGIVGSDKIGLNSGRGNA